MIIQKQQNIGILGGGFDPVHEGHIALARQAFTLCHLDQIFFIPTPRAPHKQTATPFSHRVAMLEIVLRNQPSFSLSLIEAERQTPSYTVDTVCELAQRLPDSRFFLLLGADSLRDLPHWHQSGRLLTMVDLIIAPRPGLSVTALGKAIQGLPSGYTQTSAKVWEREDGHTATLLEYPEIPLSSSSLRRRLARGERPAGIDPRVLDYIQVHGLYHQS